MRLETQPRFFRGRALNQKEIFFTKIVEFRLCAEQIDETQAYHKGGLGDRARSRRENFVILQQKITILTPPSFTFRTFLKPYDEKLQ